MNPLTTASETTKTNLSALARELGFPKSAARPTGFAWLARGGFAGQTRVISAVTRAKELGFVRVERSEAVSDATLRGVVVYRSAEGIELEVTSSFGATAANNRFSMNLRAQ